MKITKIERFIIYPILIGLLVLFAFFDLDITHSLYNPESIFGRLGENLAEAPFQMLCVFACLLLFKTRNKSSKGLDIGLGILFMTLAIIFAGYSGGRVISYTKRYGWDASLQWPLAIAFGLFNFVVPALFAWKAKIEDRNKAIAISLFIVIMWILSFVLMNALKFLWHRPRWRYLVTTEDPDAGFVPFYILGCNGGFESNYASFPSGHTINAIGVISISLLGYCFPSLDKSAFPLRLFAYVWAILCAISRIIMGAHFASDVTAGFFVGFLLFDLMSTFFLPFFVKKTNEIISKSKAKTSN